MSPPIIIKISPIKVKISPVPIHEKITSESIATKEFVRYLLDLERNIKVAYNSINDIIGVLNDMNGVLNDMNTEISTIKKSMEDAPCDGNVYGRKDGKWVVIS